MLQCCAHQWLSCLPLKPPFCFRLHEQAWFANLAPIVLSSASRRHNAPSLFYRHASSSSHLPFQDGANKAFRITSQCVAWRHCSFNKVSMRRTSDFTVLFKDVGQPWAKRFQTTSSQGPPTKRILTFPKNTCTDLMQMDATYSTFQNASAAAIQIKLQSMHPASSSRLLSCKVAKHRWHEQFLSMV